MVKNGNSAFLIARSIFESDIWEGDPHLLKLWVYLLGKAKFKKNSPEQGELRTSIRQIREDNPYSIDLVKKKWGLGRISRMLNVLQKEGRIEMNRTPTGTLIKIVKYKEYQSFDSYRGTLSRTQAERKRNASGTPTPNRTATRDGSRTPNNVNNVKNVKNKPKPCEAQNLASPPSLPEYPARQGEKEKSLVLEQTTTQGKKSDSEMSQIREVFTYWQQTFNHPKALLSKDRVGKIRSRLREDYTIPQLKRSIDGCKASKYHMGDNKYGKVYDSIGLIFRSAEKVEDFWGYLEKKKPESPTAKKLRELKEKELRKL